MKRKCGSRIRSEIDHHHQDHQHPHQGGGEPEPVGPEEVGAVPDQAAKVELSDREVPVLGHEQVDLVLEMFEPIRRHLDPESAERAHDRVDVPLDEAHQQAHERASLLRPQHAHDPEVEEGQLSLRGDEQVARVGVAVKEPVVEDLLHVRLKPDLGHLPARHPEPPDRVPVVRANAVDPLHHEQMRPREVPVDARDADALDIPHVLAQPVRVLPVADEVELAPDVLLELRDHPRGVVHGQIGEPPLDLYGDHLQDRDVLVDRLRDTRAL